MKTWKLVLSLLLVIVSILLVYFARKSASFSSHSNSNLQSKSSSSNNVIAASDSVLAGMAHTVSENSLQLETDGVNIPVFITSDTRIVRQTLSIPYLLNQNHSPLKQTATLKDITTGMAIQVVPAKESSDSQITAAQIIIPRIPYVVEGVVKSISGDSLTVDGVPVLETNPGQLSEQKHTTYTVKVTDETEISRQPEGQGGTPGMIKQYTLGTIPLDTRVIIYAMTDVTTHSEVTAARVEPIL